MAPTVEKISEPVVLGEGPHWDEKQQALYYVSIHDKTLHKYVPATGDHAKTKLGDQVGFVVPVEGAGDQFVVGLGRRFAVVQWDGADGSPARTVRQLAEVDQGSRNRLNDGKCDPRGRLFGGTMGFEEPPGTCEEHRGALYRLDGATISKVADRIGISNGLAWDLKAKAFYYIDSPDRKIRRYDYDVETGDISNMKFVFDLKANSVEGFPDGMTIDTAGNLWVAVFEGSCIIQVDPRSGKLLQKVPIPAKQVTSVTFGGPNYDILFVTTASMDIGGKQLPPCGATFMVTGLGVKGHPNVNFKL